MEKVERGLEKVERGVEKLERDVEELKRNNSEMSGKLDVLIAVFASPDTPRTRARPVARS